MTYGLEGRCSIQLSYGQYVELDEMQEYYQMKNGLSIDSPFFYLFAVQGFEPWTPWSQTRCATGLRHTPKCKIIT